MGDGEVGGGGGGRGGAEKIKGPCRDILKNESYVWPGVYLND